MIRIIVSRDVKLDERMGYRFCFICIDSYLTILWNNFQDSLNEDKLNFNFKILTSFAKRSNDFWFHTFKTTKFFIQLNSIVKSGLIKLEFHFSKPCLDKNRSKFLPRGTFSVWENWIRELVSVSSNNFSFHLSYAELDLFKQKLRGANRSAFHVLASFVTRVLRNTDLAQRF